jgi:hypothetical protein
MIRRWPPHLRHRHAHRHEVTLEYYPHRHRRPQQFHGGISRNPRLRRQSPGIPPDRRRACPDDRDRPEHVLHIRGIRYADPSMARGEGRRATQDRHSAYAGLVLFGGGYPIVSGGQVVGALGISGGHYTQNGRRPGGPPGLRIRRRLSRGCGGSALVAEFAVRERGQEGAASSGPWSPSPARSSLARRRVPPGSRAASCFRTRCRAACAVRARNGRACQPGRPRQPRPHAS